MSVRYLAVNWNRQKRIYDGILAGAVVLSLGTFAAVTAVRFPAATIETILIRGLGFTGFLLLQLIVLIGPLARLDRRFLPLLYNRRHLGVTVALLGLAHALFGLFQYHAFGTVGPVESLLTSNPDLGSVSRFPFELFGLAALIVLGLMAATSHDFWLSVLGPPAWKTLHLAVYLAYAALVAHIGLGLLQDQRHPFYPLALGSLALLTVGLHALAAGREASRDRPAPAPDGWVDLGDAETIPEGRARIGMVGAERVAVFRHGNRLSCVTNVCRHQNGPLGEGRIVDGCITCPWHGYQYRPDTGTSPPPYDDRIATYDLRVAAGRVLVREGANPPGTRVEPVSIAPASIAPSEAAPEFYIGYQPRAAPATARFVRRTVGIVLVVAAGLEAGFALAQRGFDPSRFEFGTTTVVEGTIRARPYPILEVSRPGGGPADVSRYLLAAAGKHGAQSAVGGLDGRRVRLAGALAFRDNLTLLEIAGAAPAGGDAAPAAAVAPRSHGRFTLTGEIVDSKCYLGVMNPGRGKTHRGCAARCLAGGLTPLFVVRGDRGDRLEMILVTDRDEPFAGADRLAGRPITIRGEVLTDGDLWLVRVNPSDGVLDR